MSDTKPCILAAPKDAVLLFHPDLKARGYQAQVFSSLKFAQGSANQICKQRPQPGDKWHLDEVIITIKGKQFYLWRTVDQHGMVLDILMQH